MTCERANEPPATTTPLAPYTREAMERHHRTRCYARSPGRCREWVVGRRRRLATRGLFSLPHTRAAERWGSWLWLALGKRARYLHGGNFFFSRHAREVNPTGEIQRTTHPTAVVLKRFLNPTSGPICFVFRQITRHPNAAGLLPVQIQPASLPLLIGPRCRATRAPRVLLRCSAHRAEYPRIREFACSRAPLRAPTWPGVSS